MFIGRIAKKFGSAFFIVKECDWCFNFVFHCYARARDFPRNVPLKISSKITHLRRSSEILYRKSTRTINAVIVGEGVGGGDVEVKVIFALPDVLNSSSSISLISEFHLT